MRVKKQTILIVTSTYPRWFGDSTPDFVKQMAERIASRETEVHVLAPHTKGAKRKEETNGVHLYRYRYFFPAKFENIVYEGGGVDKIKKTPIYIIKLCCLVGSMLLHTLIMTLKHDVRIINPHWVVPQGFVGVLIGFITRRPVVLTVHGSDISSLRGKAMTMIKRFTLKHSDVVCVNSDATKKSCDDIYSREYEVIPMGVDMDVFKPKKPNSRLVKKYKLSNFTLLYAGRITEEKGVMYLCEAAKLLKDDGVKFHLLIAGDGPLRSQLENYVGTARMHKQVISLGWIDQAMLNEFYSVADVFVGPSLNEAQGLVFVESLASGTPVIASKVGGIVDIVKDGKDGYLVPPGSSRALYERIHELYSDPDLLSDFTAHARKSAVDRFSWSEVTDRYKKTFGEVVR